MGYPVWIEGCSSPLYLESMSPELPWEKPKGADCSRVDAHEPPSIGFDVIESTESVGTSLTDSTINKERVLKNFKFALVEFLKNLLNPYWMREEISREVHKEILRSASKKIIASLRESEIPKDQQELETYLSTSETKMLKLIQGYVKFFETRKKL